MTEKIEKALEQLSLTVTDLFFSGDAPKEVSEVRYDAGKAALSVLSALAEKVEWLEQVEADWEAWAEKSEKDRGILAKENAALKADVKTFKACWDEACNDIAALKHIIECANTPLMADVLKERDELKAELKEVRSMNKGMIDLLAKREAEENERLTARDKMLLGEVSDWVERAKKAEAELEKARRKIRALERAITETGRGDSRRIQAYRERKGEEKP
jgi:chromosome segregation ATPase